jgi:Protein of unknown function (DUF2934)
MPKSTTPRSTAVPRTTRPRKLQTNPTPASEANASASVQFVQSPLTHDVIAARAYELYLSDGAKHGRDLEHWLRAELELRERIVVES